jgi:hypothetical protein
MQPQLSKQIIEFLSNFPTQDKILFNNKQIEIDKNSFSEIHNSTASKTIAFIDGGQAEILATGNFCLSFIRIVAQFFQNNQKKQVIKHEFYLFTYAKWINEELFYESKLFPVEGNLLISEEVLSISSNDATIKNGVERAAISKVTNMTRRLSELSLANKIQQQVDFVIMDGNLDSSYKNESKFITQLNDKVCALAKSSYLFTVSGNSPVVLLNKINPSRCWRYFLNANTYFVKLHEKAKHVFRFDGNPEALPYLMQNSADALFLGYPYGLILTDKLARVSNEEKSQLRMNFLLRSENKAILEYLHTQDAHDILDKIS